MNSSTFRKCKFDDKNILRIRTCVIGSPNVGKTAVLVRYLTKRFIGEYCTGKDLLYKKQVIIDDTPSQLEIVDTSNRLGEFSFPAVHVNWADACIVVYSIQSRSSFETAAHILESIQQLKKPVYLPVLLLANQNDLEHFRQVRAEEGQALALQNSCNFIEISAAEHLNRVKLTLTALFREVRALKYQRTTVRQRKTSLLNMSKLINSLIGRNSNQVDVDKKMRTLSFISTFLASEDDGANKSKESKGESPEKQVKLVDSSKNLAKRPSFSL